VNGRMTQSERMPNLAPRSVDMVRVIRRSMRCLVFGLIGLVPILGTGLAVQALRLRQAVSAELGEDWGRLHVSLYWILGMVALWAADGAFGLPGDVVVSFVVLVMQSWHVWRSLPPESKEYWNPGRPELVWGIMFAYAGLGGSLWLLALLVYRLAKLVGGV
jgi:hypothetical protein